MRPDHLLHMQNGEAIGLVDDLPNANLFGI